ncbi:MAG: transglutaminase domain-containing protein [Bacteroidota bacterium]
MKHIVLILVLLTSGPFSFALDAVDDRLIEHAEAYQSEEIVLEKLVNYLIKACDTETEKAEIIYYWIAQNISYNVDGYLDGSYQTDTQNILRTRVGVCEDYADLYRDMARLAGLEAYAVRGYAKGLDAESDMGFQAMNHAWNIVKVGGEYKFLDSCWGSGIVMPNKELVIYYPKMQLQYILTLPREMLDTHLPADPLWQLSKTPIDMQAFLGEGNKTYLNCSSSNPYPVVKKLAAFKELNAYGQAVVSYTRSYKFHPTDANLECLMLAYQHAGYELLQGDFDAQKIHRGISFYKRSAQLLQKMEVKTIRAELLVEDAQQAIEYGYHRLSTKF